MGTPDIAVPFMKAVSEKHTVVCAVTQPDKPRGRGHKITRCPVAALADEMNIDVLKPTTFKDMAFMPYLEKYNPDVIVVVAYGRILPKYVLDYPKYHCINVHASLLPKHRGACPINKAIMEGDKVTGVTTMLMAEGLDSGDMLLKQEIEITDTMTAGILHDTICEKSPAVLMETLEKIDTIIPKKQNENEATYTGMLTKENTTIDWTRSAKEICNFVRGLNPFPCAHTSYGDMGVKVYNVIPCDKKGTPGEILECEKRIVVACGDGAVIIDELQLGNKKRMKAEDLLRGFKMDCQEVFK